MEIKVRIGSLEINNDTYFSFGTITYNRVFINTGTNTLNIMFNGVITANTSTGTAPLKISDNIYQLIRERMTNYKFTTCLFNAFVADTSTVWAFTTSSTSSLLKVNNRLPVNDNEVVINVSLPLIKYDS